MQELDQGILNQLTQAKHAVILSHRSPDGDSIGSSLAMWHYLKKLGVESQVITPDPAPDFLSWLNGFKAMINGEQHTQLAQEKIKAADLIFCLDFNSPGRIAQLEPFLEENKSALKINIDHHQEPLDFCNLQLVDTSASSTAELVYQFVERLSGIDLIDLPAAEAIYTGILTDTGSFRFASTSSKTHQIVSKLIEKGVKPEQVHSRVYDSYSAERLRLLGYALNEGLKLYRDQQLAIIALDQKLLAQFNFKRGDTEGLVNYPLSIKSVKVSILLTEKEGKIRMSFRSKADLAVNEFARDHFDGGGHINAAGGIYHGGMPEALAKLESLIDDLF